MSFDSINSAFHSKNKINRMSIRWGGIAGDGLQATGLLLAKYFNRLGYNCFGFPGTQSTIRGGHIWYHLEFSSDSLYHYDRSCDILIAFNIQTIDVHGSDLKDSGVLIINSDEINSLKNQEELLKKKISILKVPLNTLAKEIDTKRLILKNTIVAGIILKLLNVEPSEYKNILEINFEERKQIIQLNFEALNKGINFYNENIKNLLNKDDFVLLKPKNSKNTNLMISGNEMVAIGAVASGLKFLAQYPITPASSILKYLANHAKKYGIVVRQIEDEIAAIISIVGASWSGVRAMTATSGPGFSLMAEGLGYAGMTESPIVIIISQRAGPSTGVPTKMEQADLLPALYSSHGEFPRLILAPRNVEECFESTVKAFNLADKYQLPAIILLDFALSERIETIKPFSLDVPIDRGYIWTEPTEDDPIFKRFKLSENGISPRTIPGTKDAIHVLVGAEHDEFSHSLSGNRCGIPSSNEMREKMIHKRFKKLKSLEYEMDAPRWLGPSDADFTILCWGSVEGALYDSILRLNQEKNWGTWNVLSFRDLFPLPVEKIIPELKKIKKGIFYEVNYLGQLEQLIFLYTHWQPISSLNSLGGETPTGKEIISKLKIIYDKFDSITPKVQDLVMEEWY